jgi:hypothetical protein
MRRSQIAIEPLILAAVIPLVILIFRVIPDRKIAATCAGLLFVGIPLVLMIRRWKAPLAEIAAKRLWWAGVLQFWLFFAVPILGARLLFWEFPFEEMSFFVLSGPQMHKLSNTSFMLMVVAVIAAGWIDRRKAE